MKARVWANFLIEYTIPDEEPSSIRFKDVEEPSLTRFKDIEELSSTRSKDIEEPFSIRSKDAKMFSHLILLVDGDSNAQRCRDRAHSCQPGWSYNGVCPLI